jgi:hypothetical protein
MATANVTTQDAIDENQPTANTTTQDAVYENPLTANTTAQYAIDENQPTPEQAKSTVKNPVIVELSEVRSSSDITIPLSASWTPVFLHLGFFVCCAILFISMIIVLEVLYWLSERDHGLAGSSQDRHYFWTYGPAAGKAMLIVAV